MNISALVPFGVRAKKRNESFFLFHRFGICLTICCSGCVQIMHIFIEVLILWRPVPWYSRFIEIPNVNYCLISTINSKNDVDKCAVNSSSHCRTDTRPSISINICFTNTQYAHKHRRITVWLPKMLFWCTLYIFRQLPKLNRAKKWWIWSGLVCVYRTQVISVT